MPTGQKAADELRDIYGYYAIEIPLWLLLLIFLIIGALIGIFVYNKYFKNKEEIVLTNFESTVQGLQDLRVSDASKYFYLRYTDLIRNYLQKELEFAILDKTSEELKGVLKEEDILNSSQIRFIIDSFGRGDLAKFAMHEVHESDKQKDVMQAVDLITEINQAIEERKAREAEQAEISENSEQDTTLISNISKKMPSMSDIKTAVAGEDEFDEEKAK